MNWSHAVGKIAGTEIRIHYTFYILLAFLGISFYAVGGAAAALNALIFIIALFACVLLHEGGHAFAARRYGIHTPDITLLPIGGLARLQRMPDRPAQELVVALAGPLVNVVLAAILFALPWVDLRIPTIEEIGDPATLVLTRLAWVNVILVIFNLIPAFPMDGGRVLRSLLALALPYVQATRIAAGIGQVFALLFGLLGLLAFNPILILIAFFVYFGAQQEAQAVQIRQIGKETAVEEAMINRLSLLNEEATLEDVVDKLIHSTQREFPMVDQDGKLLGVLTRDDMISALRSNKRDAPATEFIRRDLPQVSIDDTVDAAFRAMQENGVRLVSIQDHEGNFAGILSLESIGELLMLDSLRSSEQKPLWR